MQHLLLGAGCDVWGHSTHRSFHACTNTHIQHAYMWTHKYKHAHTSLWLRPLYYYHVLLFHEEKVCFPSLPTFKSLYTYLVSNPHFCLFMYLIYLWFSCIIFFKFNNSSIPFCSVPILMSMGPSNGPTRSHALKGNWLSLLKKSSSVHSSPATGGDYGPFHAGMLTGLIPCRKQSCCELMGAAARSRPAGTVLLYLVFPSSASFNPPALPWSLSTGDRRDAFVLSEQDSASTVIVLWALVGIGAQRNSRLPCLWLYSNCWSCLETPHF